MEPPAAAAAAPLAAARRGKKRALLIGINYVGKPAELAGCVNDIIGMSALCTELGYDEVCILYDGVWTGVNGAPSLANIRAGGPRPTRANMEAAFGWLVAGAGPGDLLFLHYSGHGGQLPERVAGSEATGMDDTVVPVDYETAGMLRDDDLRALLVEPLRHTGASLRVALDCCHSGTGMDLRYNLAPQSAAPPPAWGWGEYRESAPAAPEGQQGVPLPAPEGASVAALVARLTAEAVRRELRAWFGDALVEKCMGAPGEQASEFSEWTNYGVTSPISGSAISGRSVSRALAAAAPDVIAVSGCADRQTSADAWFAGHAGGALTHYLLAALRRGPRDTLAWPTAVDLLRDLSRGLRKGGYTQVPQISSEVPVTGLTRFNLA